MGSMEATGFDTIDLTMLENKLIELEKKNDPDHVDFREYDETIEVRVKFKKCPHCGKEIVE
jgi:hypothetical protein